MPPRSALLLASLLLAASAFRPEAARAFDCEAYQQCCLQLVEAYREAGASSASLSQFEETCYLSQQFSAMPGLQQLFCPRAWESTSREAFKHFRQGRIGFYPDACMDDPLEDSDAILEPEPALPGAAPPEPGD